MYGVDLSLDRSQSTIFLVYPIRVSSCALVKRNTVLTFILNLMLPKVFDSSRTPQAISTSCFFVSNLEWVAGSLLSTALSCLAFSLMSAKALAFPALLCLLRREWTKQAVSLRRSFTRDDLRRCWFSSSKTTYACTSAQASWKDGRLRDLESMLILRLAGAGICISLE